MPLPTTIATWPSHTARSLMGRPLGPFGARPAAPENSAARVRVPPEGGCGALMSSTPFAYSQVISRTFASFRVVNSSVSAGQRDCCSGFDSRQLHRTRTVFAVIETMSKISTGELRNDEAADHQSEGRCRS